MSKKTLNMLPNLGITGATDSTMNLDFEKPFADQVREYFKNIFDPRGINRVALVGQATAAILALPVLEMLGGLPEIALIPFRAREIAGWLDSRTFRHDICREMRIFEDAEKQAPAGYTVIDGGGRGLTPEQVSELAKELGCGEEEIHVFSTNPGQVDLVDLGGKAGVAVAEGIKSAMIEGGFPVNETPDTSRLLFVPAGAGIVGMVQALALHGFTGTWPRTVRIAGTPADGFHVKEVVDPQAMRQWAVGLADRLEKAEAPIQVPREILKTLLLATREYRGESTGTIFGPTCLSAAINAVENLLD